MTGTEHRVLIFEDNPDHLKFLLEGLKEKLQGEELQVLAYDDSVALPEEGENEAVREYLGNFLLEPDPALLVLLDWEIHLLKHPIHKELVQGFCEQEGLPVCIYVNQEGRTQQVQNMKRWQETQISLDTMLTLEEILDQGASIIRGFHRIWHAIDEAGGIPDIGDLSQSLLSPPESAAAQIDQYSWGDMSALQVPQSEDQAQRFMHLNTGYWIFNRLLQFPGVLLNAAAAASYLGIDVDTFTRRSDVQAQFQDALYQGPFCETGPYWWTTKLDDILVRSTPDEEAVWNGLQLVRHNVEDGITEVRCPGNGNPHNGAGYYCILTKLPVCAEHSKKPGSWLPPGADRCRIEMTEHAKWGPWLQL